LALEPRINAAGIRILSSASTVSAIAAAIIRQSAIEKPVRVSGFLVPASRHTVNPGAALALLRCVGQPIQVWRDGGMKAAVGWSEPRHFPKLRPLGSICGRLFETADAVLLPRIWPSLREVAMYVDANTLGVNGLLRLAARSSLVHRVLVQQARLGTRLAKWFGSPSGGVGYEIEDDQGRISRYAMTSGASSYLTAVAPAVLATQAIIDGRFEPCGLVSPDRQIEPAQLAAFLEREAISWSRVG
jgi:hypothetical protein